MLIIRTISAVLSLLIAFILPYTPPQNKCAPKFNGTFLQSWMSCTWDDERWQTEISDMKDAGIEYLIIQDLASQTNGTWELYYDSALPEFADADYCGADVVENTLRNCKGSGIKVFIGLALHESWWVTAGVSPEYAQTCKTMASMVEEIYSLYGEEYADTLYGWYFTPEISANAWVSASIGSIASGINTVIDAINKTDASKPLLLSPFMFESTNMHTLTVALPMWIKFFDCVNLRDGDIFCPQDSVGCNVSKIDTIENVWRMYAKAVEYSKCDVRLWANCENFTSPKESQKGLGTFQVETEGYAVTSTLDRFTEQMKFAARYAENIITFSYNHYYCPDYVNSVFIDTYLDYCQHNYTLETEVPTAPTNLTAAVDEGGISLNWGASQDNIGIAYYRICADGKFVGRVEAKHGTIATQFTDTQSRSAKAVYTVIACDGAGNVSAAAETTVK